MESKWGEVEKRVVEIAGKTAAQIRSEHLRTKWYLAIRGESRRERILRTDGTYVDVSDIYKK